MKIRGSLLAGTLALSLLAPFACAVDSVSVFQLAVTGMEVPGSGGVFTSFSAPTTDRDRDFVTSEYPFFFTATTSDGVSGVYVDDGYSAALAVVADTTMAAPTGGTFTSFSNVSSGSGEVGFLATDSNGEQGLYVKGILSSDLALVATSDSSPQAGVTFGDFQNISIAGNPDGFGLGEIESDAGIYDYSYDPGNATTFTFVASTSTTPPGAAGPFTSLGPVSYKPALFVSNIAGIRGTIRATCAIVDGVQGIYYGGVVQGVITASAPLVDLISAGAATPDGAGQFTSFGNPVATSNEVAFTAHYSIAGGDQQGVFIYGGYSPGGDPTYPPIVLRQIVASGQVAPGSGGATFAGFSDLSDTSYDTTFLASLSDGNEGLHINVAEDPYDPPLAEIVKVVETGDLLDGKIVDGIELAPDASNLVDLSELAGLYPEVGIGFEASFTDGSEGLYYFTVNLPEPAALCMLALPAMLIRRRRISVRAMG